MLICNNNDRKNNKASYICPEVPEGEGQTIFLGLSGLQSRAPEVDLHECWQVYHQVRRGEAESIFLFVSKSFSTNSFVFVLRRQLYLFFVCVCVYCTYVLFLKARPICCICYASVVILNWFHFQWFGFDHYPDPNRGGEGGKECLG